MLLNDLFLSRISIFMSFASSGYELPRITIWTQMDGNHRGRPAHLHRSAAALFIVDLVFLSGKHGGLIIALLPYAPSCCCFIAFFSCRGFNKGLYLFVTTQTALALTAELFNFLTGYLLEGGGVRGWRGH